MLAIISHAWNDDLTGGAFKVATDYARWIARQGVPICYLCGADQSLVSDKSPTVAESIDGVDVYRYAYPEHHGGRALWSHVRRMSALFQEVMRCRSIEYVSGHSPLQYYAVARQRSRFPNVQFTFSVHSPFADEFRASGRTAWLTQTLAKTIDGRCLKYSDQVTTDSHYTLDRLQSLYGTALGGPRHVRSPWVDVDRFRPSEDRRALRESLGDPWQSDIPTFVSVRRLERRMGLDRLIDAAARLLRQGRNLRLLIGGSGSMESELRQQIIAEGFTNEIQLLGRIPESQLVATYAAADAFVLPTTALECFGLITLEAYACGVPVIATPVAAIPEIVRQHDATWLTTDTSATAIAERMDAFLAGQLRHDPGELRSIALRYALDRQAAALDAVVRPLATAGVSRESV